MKTRFAFAGFRHGHIMALVSEVMQDPTAELVAACEEDAVTRERLAAEGKVRITHDRFTRMLAEVECDVVAIGDYYARRGSLAIAALEAGKHVIADKPLCVSLDELARIESLAAARGRAVGCQLSMRSSPGLLTMRGLIQAGTVGEVQTVTFTGQHPRMLGTRPDWYFKPGCHGGTINDIGIHAFDFIGWLTGRQIVEVVAARTWNRRTAEHPSFQDGAQMMLRLDNDGGVLGDVSYLSPDRCGFTVPQYWRVTCHGTGGVLEMPGQGSTVFLATHGDEAPRYVPHVAAAPGTGYYHDFMRQVRGEPVPPDALTTRAVLQAARLALTTQAAADTRQVHVDCRAGV